MNASLSELIQRSPGALWGGKVNGVPRARDGWLLKGLWPLEAVRLELIQRLCERKSRQVKMSTSEFPGIPRIAEPAAAGESVRPAATVQPRDEVATRRPDAEAEQADTCVMCTDLDGTLLRCDSLWEAVILLIKSQPAALLLMPLWLFRGKAYFKCELARRASLNPATLPYREDVLEFLRRQKESGRTIVLATGSNRKIADAISGHLGLFSTVLASDETVNLVGSAKLSALRELIGNGAFDYIGNGRADLAIWRAAQKSFVVTPSRRLLARVKQTGTVAGVFAGRPGYASSVFAALRVHHWTKNLLLFVPLLLAHKMLDSQRLLTTILAFFGFSFLASTGYVINDLLDLEADRVHPVKKFRPLAYGTLPVWMAGLIIVPLAAGTLLLSWLIFPANFAGLLTCYFACSVVYSQYLKRLPVLDVLILAGLYTLRLLAGAVAASVSVSPWLLGFSMFFFLSLAYVKRFSEVFARRFAETPLQNRRGYGPSDHHLFRTVGPVSGYISVLVFALYLNGREVAELYGHPQYLWFVGPLLLYWITRIWLLAERGEMNQDPVVFAMRDKASYVIGALVLLVLLLAV